MFWFIFVDRPCKYQSESMILVSLYADTKERMWLSMKKAFFALTAILGLAAVTATEAAAQSLTPATGDRSVELLPIFIVLIILAIAAMVACLVIFKKKK